MNYPLHHPQLDKGIMHLTNFVQSISPVFVHSSDFIISSISFLLPIGYPGNLYRNGFDQARESHLNLVLKKSDI